MSHNKKLAIIALMSLPSVLMIASEGFLGRDADSRPPVPLSSVPSKQEQVAKHDKVHVASVVKSPNEATVREMVISQLSENQEEAIRDIVNDAIKEKQAKLTEAFRVVRAYIHSPNLSEDDEYKAAVEFIKSSVYDSLINASAEMHQAYADLDMLSDNDQILKKQLHNAILSLSDIIEKFKN